jgi:hypothetical protein
VARHLYIAGVDRWKDLEREGNSPAMRLDIDMVLTYQIDVCRFYLKGDQPAEGEEVIIEDSDLGRLFAGIIVKVEMDRVFPDKSVKVWQVECDDYTALLDRRLVVEAYENMSASDIFLDIVAKYCPGFTTNGVRSGAPVIESTGAEFEYKRPSECFRWLCDYCGWHWFPDYHKDLHFFSADELASPAPMVLRPGGQFRFGKHTIDTQGLRNRVYVRGGTMLSDPQVVQWKADGVARIWTLPWGPHEVDFEVGEVSQSVGVENLHDEADFDYMMSFSEKYIRCSSQTPTPAEGTTMSLTAKQDIAVITMVEDYASQAAIAKVQGGDGIYEHVISDDTLTSIAAAEAAGMADLREHANPRVKGSFETEYIKPPESVPTALDYTESGEDFAIGELDGVVVGEDGLELELSMGKALSFDGVDDYVSIPTQLNINTDFTIEAIIKVNAPLNNRHVVFSVKAVAGDYWFFINRADRGLSLQYDRTVDQGASWICENSNPILPMDGFVHIAMTRSGDTWTIYRDGQVIASEVAAITGLRQDVNFIGFDGDSTNINFFNGVIDDVRIWNVARTQQQIQDNMNKELTGNEIGLIGYWKFNKGEGSVAYDSTENENDGTISGATWVDTPYKEQGSRISLPLDLSSVGTVKTSEISWQATEPTDTSLKVETSLSTDSGETWGAWQQATNGGSIPGIVADMDLSNAKLKTRATLETEDTSVTPALNNLTINLTGEKLESHNWQPGQIVEINLPDRGIQGEYLIQRVTTSPLTPKLWTFRVEYGGRLFGIADFLQALVSAQQKRRYMEPTKNVQKYIYGEETLELSDTLTATTRALPFICGDSDAICGMVVVSDG